MLHADALQKTYGRQSAFCLDLSRYADASETWGRLPVVIICGDELQLPPVPIQHSLLASLEGTSYEHKAGVRMFSGFEHVYRLTAMRFNDPTLVPAENAHAGRQSRWRNGLLGRQRQNFDLLLLFIFSGLERTPESAPVSMNCALTRRAREKECWQRTSMLLWPVVSLAYACRSFA